MNNVNENELFSDIRRSVLLFDEERSAELCQQVLDYKMNPVNAVSKGLAAGMTDVSAYYQSGEYSIPELLLCADALYAGLEILEPHLKKQSQTEAPRKIILGVVQGDIHDIGKNLIKAMFITAGWDVYDVGKNVAGEAFISAQNEFKADIIGLSSLMTISLNEMPDIIKTIRRVDPAVKIMVGGASLNPEIAQNIGADGYAQNLLSVIDEANRLIKMTESKVAVS